MFEVRGIPVRLHPTLWALVVGLLLWTLVADGVGAAARGALWGGVLIGSVLVHELGHALVARRYGIRTRSIVLLPFGGAAQLEMRPGGEPPRVDLVVSAAGPGASLLLGVLAGAVGWLTGSELLLMVGAINLLLGVFNLLPAFPMDGGRMLRAGLTPVLGVRRATLWALGVGAGLAALLLVGGTVRGEVGLSLLALFLWFTQYGEWRVLQARTRLSATPGAEARWGG